MIHGTSKEELYQELRLGELPRISFFNILKNRQPSSLYSTIPQRIIKYTRKNRDTVPLFNTTRTFYKI